jgi:hypothetical protein
MGCDIHFHSEVKIKGKWYHYAKLSIGRNYNLFAKMAGVRNEGRDIIPISKNRGIPKDATFLTKYDYKLWEVDAHSANWLNAKEIVELENWWHKNSPKDVWFEDEFGYLFGNSWGGIIRYPNDTKEGVEDIRFIFWFDN